MLNISLLQVFFLINKLAKLGLILTQDVHWICFHGIFDFAYLVKMLTGEDYLPIDEYGFQETLNLYFPHYYDIKVLASPFKHLQGGLAKLCQELNVIHNNITSS